MCARQMRNSGSHNYFLSRWWFFQGAIFEPNKVNFGQFCSIAMSPFPMFSGFMRKSMWNYRPPLCPMCWRGPVATSRAITKTTNSSTQTWTSWPITTIQRTKLSSAFGPCPSTPRSLYWVVFVFVFALALALSILILLFMTSVFLIPLPRL